MLIGNRPGLVVGGCATQATGTAEREAAAAPSSGGTTRHKGYAISQTRRKMVECPFGRGRQHGTI